MKILSSKANPSATRNDSTMRFKGQRQFCCVVLMSLYTTVNISSVFAQSIPTTISIEKPDTTGVWYHIRQNQKTLANSEFGRLKSVYPDWAPSQDLVDALDKLNNPQPIIPSVSDSTEAVPSVSPAQLMFAELSRLSQAEWLTVSSEKLEDASKLAETAQRADYHRQLGWIWLARQNYSKAIDAFGQAKHLAPLSTSDEGTRIAQQALVERQAKLLEFDQLALLQTQYPKFDVNQAVGTIAWQAFDDENLHIAVPLFEYVNNVSGLVYSLEKQSKKAAALSLACNNTEISELADYCVNQLAEKQANSYNAKQHQLSLDFANQIRKIRTLTPPQLELYGWSSLELGYRQSAISAFEQLSELQPDNESFINALFQLAQGDAATIERLATNYPQLGVIAAQQRGQLAWGRKQFDLAFIEGFSVDLSQRDRLAVYTGIQGKQRSGDDGLGNFDILNGYVGLTNLWRDWRWNLRFDYEQLYSGTGAENQWFGNGQIIAPFNSITGFEDKGIRLSLSRQSQHFSFYSQLQYSLFDQPTDTRLTGQLSGVWYRDNTTYAVTLYSDRKEDSLLSMAGTYVEDAETGWGRVVSTGMKGLVVTPVSDNWSVAVTADLASLEGVDVASNHMTAVRIDFNTDASEYFELPLDYLRVGPYLGWQKYNENLSGFTFGHGGYFSPQSLINPGVFAELLTTEGTDWQVKGSASLGYNWIEQDANTRFPLVQGSGPFIESTTNQGLGGELRLEGQYLLGKNWVIAGYARRAFAVQYQAFHAGIQIRWHAGHTKGITSDWLILSDPRLTGFAF